MRPTQLTTVTLSALLFCLGLLVPSGFTSAAAAAPYGSSQGTPFQQECGSGRMTGVSYYLGIGAMTSIAAICHILEGGTPTGEPVILDQIGQSGSDGRYESNCPDDMVVIAVSVTLGANDRVIHLRLTCHVANGQNKKGFLVKATRSPPQATETSHRTVPCPSDQYASGIVGTTDIWVNSLGIICNVVEVSNSGGNGGGGGNAGGGGGGSGATINAAVDLYNNPGGTGTVIGMLRQGAQVTASCRPDNWCKVEGGWVWGDFVDR